MLRDVLHLGRDEVQIHAELAEDVVASGVDKVFVCGPLMQNLYEALPLERRGAASMNVSDLYAAVKEYLRPGDVITVKGGMGHGGLGDREFMKLCANLKAERPSFG